MMISSIRLQILIGVHILAISVTGIAGEGNWIEVKSPNFTIVSNASFQQAREAASSLERYRTAFQAALPRFKVDSGSPLICFAISGSDALKSLLSREQERNAAQRMGTFLASSERDFMVVRLDLIRDERYHVIYHEYAHAIVRLNFQNPPAWIAEGMAELFGSAIISNRSSVFGNAGPASFRILRSSPILPLEILMTAGPDSAFYRRQGLSEIFYAESFALTHYLMLGDNGAHVQQMDDYLRLAQNEIPAKEAAERAFGSLSSLQLKLQRYVTLPIFKHFKAEARLSIDQSRYSARNLPPAESLTYQGWLLANTDRLTEAQTALEQALHLDPGNTSAYEAMGWLHLRLGNPDQAKKYFSIAAELDSGSFTAQYYTAELEYERGGNYALAEKALRKALAIEPDSLPACEMLAYILTAKPEKLPEAFELATKLAAIQPDQPRHRILIAKILSQMGREEEAQAAAQRLLAEHPAEPERRQAESLLSRLKQKRDRVLESNRQLEIIQEQLKLVEERRRKDKELEERIRSEALMRKLNAETNKVKTGPARKAMGSIQAVKCSDPAIMDVVLDPGRNQKAYTLRADNFYRVQYWSLGPNSLIGFQPCGDLKGKDAIIKFLSVSGQEFEGFIQSIEFVKETR